MEALQASDNLFLPCATSSAHRGQEYNLASALYESSLSIQKRKCEGIFYTDFQLAYLILEELSFSPDKIVLDPCCGTGVFLHAAKEKGYKYLYGIDIDGDALMISKKFTQNAKLIQMDSIFSPLKKIAESTKIDKFDYIIGNPPYANASMVSDSLYSSFGSLPKTLANKNLFTLALERGISLLSENGVLSYIIPKNFLYVAVYKRLRKFILEHKSIISITDIGSYFKNVRGEQIVLTIKNSTPINNTISIKKLVGEKFETQFTIDQAFFRDEIILFTSERELNIYRFLQDRHKTLCEVMNGYIGRGRSTGDHTVSGRDIRKFGYKAKKIPDIGNQVFIQNIYSAEAGIIAAFGGELEASETVTIFTDSNKEMCKYILGILHSDLCNYFLLKFCFNSGKLTLHTDAQYLKKIPFSVKDKESFNTIVHAVTNIEQVSYLTPEWYNAMKVINRLVYEAFDICSEMAAYISSEVKSMQSNKWNV